MGRWVGGGGICDSLICEAGLVPKFVNDQWHLKKFISHCLRDLTGLAIPGGR